MDDCEIEELGHAAEIGLRLAASTLADLFRCAALGMARLTGDAPSAGARTVRTVTLVAPDLESLLVDWLNELVYLAEVDALYLDQVEIQEITPTALSAQVAGRAVQEPPSVQIKAATYHQLSIRQHDAGWQAEVFFDI